MGCMWATVCGGQGGIRARRDMIKVMERKMMQLLQAVVAPEASGEEEKVHLVVSMDDGHRLQQALQFVPPQKKVVLVHIHRPAMMIPIPTMGGAVHASILKDDIVRAYREEQRGQALEALKDYQEICTRAEVPAEILTTENDNVAAGLLELIVEHKIATLIIVGISKSWVNRSKRNLAAALQKDADPTCNILFMHKGRLISISQPDGSVFAFETKETPSSIGSRRLSLSCSSGSTPSPCLWDSSSTPSSVFWHSRSTPGSLDPSLLDDPSLENACGSIFDDSRLIAILGHESIDTLRELAHHPNLTECSQGWHQAFQSKNSEISSGYQLIGGIDLVLGANCENFGEEYWKTINGWSAAFELIVRVLNTMLQQLSHNSSDCDGLTPDKLSTAAKKLINRLLDVASDVTGVRKTPEKLFCILYMHKAIVDSDASLRRVLPEDFESKVDRIITVLNDSARGILRDFKMLIQKYSSQKVEQDGSILLITRYVMKYIRLLVKHARSLDPILGCGQDNGLFFSKGSSDLLSDRVSFTGHLVRELISDLNNVVEEKSSLYASHQGLRPIFLMNNVHFIIQEVEHSDIQLILGAEWLKHRWDEFDMYMRDYMSSTWEKATYYLTVAASPPRKRLRPGLLGIFHTNARPWQSFNSCFKETCDSQMHWKVPCPVLRSRLREIISQHVVEAYQVYLETLNHPSIGSAGDLKSIVSELFEGST